MYDDYAKLGVKFILVVGSDNQQKPSTVAFAKAYAQNKGYQDGWIVVNDPYYAAMNNSIEDTYKAIPFHAILDEDLVLRHVSSSQSFSWTTELTVMKILKAKGLR
jgi:hypothetical protein